jgi:hypothetical protein
MSYPTSIKLRQRELVMVPSQELRRLFAISSEISDLIENLFEQRAEYGEEFLRGLRKSLQEARQGKLYPVNSLRDLR